MRWDHKLRGSLEPTAHLCHQEDPGNTVQASAKCSLSMKFEENKDRQPLNDIFHWRKTFAVLCESLFKVSFS